MSGRVATVVLVAATLASASPGTAQTVPFGKNKIQYNDFDWFVLRGPHVDVYYYPEEEEVALHALSFAEESYDALERLFQHHPFGRIPLIVYSSHHHFEQTNVLPGFIPEGVLGFTEYLKRRVALPFRGDYDQFRTTLRHELVHAFQLSKLAETRSRHPKQRGESPQLVHWWTEGLAEHWSGEQTTEDDMFVRDLVLNGGLPTLRQLTRSYGFASYPLGGALHGYLSARFGDGYIVRMYEEYRTYDSFEQALEGILGVELDQLDREWRYALEQRFFPDVALRAPPDVAARRIVHVGGANFKPVVWQAPTDSTVRLIFLSPRDGYTSVYVTRLRDGEEGVEVLVRGEREPEFESFHAYESGMDISRAGILVFVSRYLDRDALLLWDLSANRLVGRYQWPDLVGLKSPSWDPGGRRIVFEGLSTAGFSDLYVADFERNELLPLMRDHYRDADPDWSPDGSTIVFASDRALHGEKGYTNLIAWDVATGTMRFLTHGPWHDQQPRWAPDGNRLAFTSDRSGFFDLYELGPDGRGRRLTTMTGGAFDADWLPEGDGLVFTGYQDGRFALYQASLPPDTSAALRIALEAAPAVPTGSAMNGRSEPTGVAGWVWATGRARELAPRGPIRYVKWNRFTLDFAAADGIIAPGLGAAQGAQFLATDLLGDHIVFGGLAAAQLEGASSFLDSFSGNLLYLNLKRRLNYGVGAFRFKGRFRDVALDAYDESTWGGYFLASYPFSKFRRVELQLGIEHSHRRDLDDVRSTIAFARTARADPRDLTRTGILTRNYVSLVKDNTLWLGTGPIDGERYNITAGLVTCFRCTTPSGLGAEPARRPALAESFVLLADYRRYFRTSLHSAYAVRGFAFWSEGAIPGRAVLGGTWMLRGYPRYSLAGSRVWLINQEWRFPLLDGLSLAFPFGDLRLPGVQGALFADLGSSWLEHQAGAGGAWGSYGLGFRSSLGPPFVLRLDVGRRFKTATPPPVLFGAGNGFNDTFIDFFFGFNF